MNRKLRAVIAGTGAAAIVVAGASAAFAATPPWQPGGGGSGKSAPDPNNVGTLAFFNSSGTQVLSGSTLTPDLASYIQATGLTPLSGNTKATLYAYTPNSGANPGAWSGQALSGATTFPNSSAPGSLGTSAQPLVTASSADGTIEDYAVNAFPNGETTAGYQNVYELRVKTSGTGGSDPHYASADVLVDLNNHTWTQVFPAVNAQTTTTVASVNPTSATTASTPVTLGATVTAGSGTPTGSVQFQIDGSNVGSAQNLSGGTASLNTTAGAFGGAGSHTVTAVYTSSQPAQFGSSTSAGVAFQYNPPAINTTTSLAVSPASGNAFSSQTLTATVTAASGTALPAGTVAFVDSANGALGSAPVTGSGTPGTATLVTNALGAGSHTITATYTPSNPAAFNGSNGSAPAFTLNAVGATPDPQTITVTVAPGSLTISTPYTPQNPFVLPQMVLDPAGTKLTSSAPFGSSTLPTGSNPYAGVTITDTRAGNQSWTASAAATDFTSGSNAIDSTYLGFTGVSPLYIPGNALNAASNPIVTGDVPAPALGAAPTAPTGTLGQTGYNPGSPGLKGAPHAFATAAHGDGSVYVYGTLGLTAPTSTVAGTYTATLTFTLA
jgi:hypothetical protein